MSEDRYAAVEKRLQQCEEVLTQLAADLDLAIVNILRALKPEARGTPQQKQTHKDVVPESVFSPLKWDLVHSDKMGDYEIAGAPSNPGQSFKDAFTVLSGDNATIKTRYHGSDYQFSYWLYGENRIYRQRIKGA